MRQYKIDNSDRKAYPFGLTIVEGGIHVSVAVPAATCSLLLFLPSSKRDPIRIPFPEGGRIGNVWEMTVLGGDLDRYEYAFEADGRCFPDPYGHTFTGQEDWGRTEQIDTLLHSPIHREEFDWAGDKPLRIPYEDCVIYRAHVRGFTRHPSSKVKNKGTFRGIAEKIPYLKELGVTTLELMPFTEFSEVMVTVYQGGPTEHREASGKLNYWGYGPALNGAPKASYAGKRHQPDEELKQLVKELHQAGIELVTELFFTGEETPSFVLDMVRRWVREYHLDGIHLVGKVRTDLLAGDPYLAHTKLWADSWGDVAGSSLERHLAEYNDGFLIDMRRVLRGDEDRMKQLAFCSRHNPTDRGVIHYMANTNGFTLMDMVCYEQKHNEENGEQNRDGTSYNYTWNCGTEGPNRKKKILSLRRQQLRNALLLLFLSQGTPLLMAGDEFGNSQGGNNNAYCQDNEISWLNWNQQKTNRDLLEFVRYVIRFRREHPVFHGSREPRLMDYQACGLPDVSYHGGKAWVPEFDHFRRHLGILYCGEYGQKADGTKDDSFFVAYNMHWEPHEFALPHLPGGLRWHVAFDTADSKNNGFYEPGQEPERADQKRMMASPRSITVLIGKPATVNEEKTKEENRTGALQKQPEPGREEAKDAYI